MQQSSITWRHLPGPLCGSFDSTEHPSKEVLLSFKTALGSAVPFLTTLLHHFHRGPFPCLSDPSPPALLTRLGLGLFCSITVSPYRISKPSGLETHHPLLYLCLLPHSYPHSAELTLKPNAIYICEIINGDREIRHFLVSKFECLGFMSPRFSHHQQH